MIVCCMQVMLRLASPVSLVTRIVGPAAANRNVGGMQVSLPTALRPPRSRCGPACNAANGGPLQVT